MFRLKSLVDDFVSEALARSRPVVAWAVEHKPKTLAGWLAFSSAAGAACAALAALAVAWLSVFAFAAVVLCGATLFLCFALGVWLTLTAWLAVALAVAAGCAAGWLLVLRGGVQLVAAVWSRALPRALTLSGMADRGLWPAPSAHKATAAAAAAAPATAAQVSAPPATATGASASAASAAPAPVPKAATTGAPGSSPTSSPPAAADRHHHLNTAQAGTSSHGLPDMVAGRGSNTAGNGIVHTTHTPTTTTEPLVTAAATSPHKGGHYVPLGDRHQAGGPVQGEGDRGPSPAMVAAAEGLFNSRIAALRRWPEIMEDMTAQIMELQDLFKRLPVSSGEAPSGVELRCDQAGGPADEGGCGDGVGARMQEGVADGEGEEERGQGGVRAVGGGASAGAGAVQQREEGSGQEAGGGARGGGGGAGSEGEAVGVGGLAGSSGNGRNGRSRVACGGPAGEVSVSA